MAAGTFRDVEPDRFIGREVKAAFQMSGEASREHMWVMIHPVERSADGAVVLDGTLRDHPVAVPLCCGDCVSVPLAAIEDVDPPFSDA
jgi:hypothetical protein